MPTWLQVAFGVLVLVELYDVAVAVHGVQAILNRQTELLERIAAREW